MKITIAGAAGYVGRRLSDHLEKQGHTVTRWTRGFGDLTLPNNAFRACEGAELVFNLVADVGGIGYVSKAGATSFVATNVNFNLLQACVAYKVPRFFFASSSCVYPENAYGIAQVEAAAYPANPTTEYGWGKLYSERMCAAFSAEHNVPTTVARLHGLYGPGDIRPAGRDHVIPALVKKVIAAKLSGIPEIAIWGDGNQTRSFLHIDDCVDGIVRLSFKGVPGPVNLANADHFSINDVVTILEDIAAVKLTRFYQPTAPTGCQFKTSNNRLLRESLDWEPMIALRAGLEDVYRDEYDRALKRLK